MSDMWLEDQTFVNLPRHGEDGHKAAMKAGAAKVGEYGPDMSKWTVEQVRQFTWSIMAAGLNDIIARTQADYRKTLEGLDGIPF
jgi:hypothetical protein